MFQKQWRKMKALIAQRRTQAAIVVVCFGVIGLVLLEASHAASYVGSSEAESGVLASGARVVKDATASGGKAVQFGSVGGGRTGGGTGPAVIKAFDAWQEPSIMTKAWFQTAYDAGFRMFIIQDDTVLTSATNASTQTIVKAAEAAGLQVAAFTCSPNDYAAGINAFGGLPMAFFAFDIEPGNDPGGINCLNLSNGSGNSTIIPVTHAEVAAVQADGIRPVIYSYPYGWQGGSGFTNIPLWASQDDDNVTLENWTPSLTSPQFSPTFGGWTQSDLMGMQNVWLEYNGVWMDLDSISANY